MTISAVILSHDCAATPSAMPVGQKRVRRGLYNRAPLILRAFALVLDRHLLRFACRDGRRGVIFFFLRTPWFRLLIDAKLYERRPRAAQVPSTARPARP